MLITLAGNQRPQKSIYEELSMNRKYHYRFVELLLICLIILAGVVSGCDNLVVADTTGVVSVYNYDAEHEYRVELYGTDENVLIGSCSLTKYAEDGYVDYFDGLSAAFYYLSIYQDDSASETGRSDTFYLDEGEELSFTIESDLNIENY
jgi:hypothetical protein